MSLHDVGLDPTSTEPLRHRAAVDPIRRRTVSDDDADAAPQHLSPQMRQFWVGTVARYDLQPPQQRVLEGACCCWDRGAQARQELGKLGLLVTTRHTTKAHPLVQVERESMLAFSKLVRQLKL